VARLVELSWGGEIELAERTCCGCATERGGNHRLFREVSFPFVILATNCSGNQRARGMYKIARDYVTLSILFS